jgi:hypothetical protein
VGVSPGRAPGLLCAALIAALGAGGLASAEEGAQRAQAAAQAPAADAPAGVAYTLEQAARLIGLVPSEAFAALGAPAEVFAHRGAEGWQDDVVFYYATNLYLFWYQSRVWQVRADERFAGSFLGLRMGWTREQVVAGISRPFQELPDSIVFLLPDASLLPGPAGRAQGAYPLRLRAFFRDGRLSDLYLYRGDF